MAAHGDGAVAAVAPGVEQVVELFQNQRYRKFKGWSSRYLLNSDPGRYSDHTGGGERDRLDSRPPAGCVWADGDTGWELDTAYTRCDAEGWTYASSFRDFTSSNPGLPAAAEHGTRVRRRRYVRRGVTIDEDDTGHGTEDEDSSSVSSSRPSSRRLTGKGARGSVGSRGSRRLTGRGSVGFALAPLDEVESMRIEVVIHGESFVVSAGPNDTVRWLQQEASALFSKEHNFHTHVVQVVETYPRDVFQVEAASMAGGGESEGGDAALHPLDPESLVKKVISANDRTIFHPAPMEDGVAGVADAKVWARVQATVTVPPGPLGVVLDGEVGDRPVVLEIPGQAGPASSGMLTPGSRETMPEAFSLSPSPTGASASTAAASPIKQKPKAKAKAKVTRKDRAKRLLLSLATKHHFQNAAGAAGGGTGEITAERSSERSSERRSPGGATGVEVVLSPLVTATDAATVRPGMVLASVAARGGQGVSEEAVDTWGMGVKEAIETLVRYQHLHRAITFLDPAPGWSNDKNKALDMAGGAAGAGVTCPYSASVTVVEARGLKRSDIFTADPFAWLRLGGSSHKTNVCRSTSRPHWGETFNFALLSLERSLVVQLWDADELGADVLLGETSVNLSKLPVNNPFQPDSGGAVDVWFNLKFQGGGSGGGGSRGVRLKISIDQQLHVSIHKKKVDSAARLLQGAMRSFVFRRQTLTNRHGGPGGGGAPPLPPRGATTDSSAPAADAALAAFAVADLDAAGRVRGGGGGGGGARGRPSRQCSSRKSVAGAVGGGWEASGAHAASTLADVFPAGDGSDGDGRGGGGGGAFFGSNGAGAGGGGDPAMRGVSEIVIKFLEGPALERFGGKGGGGGGGGGILRRSSIGTTGGRRSTVASGRRSSASVRFVDGGRRSTVGGWGEGDEAARPGASVCKDCLSDIGSLLAVAMAPAEAARTTMEDATHLRYPTVLPDSVTTTPLAVVAFPTPRGGFGPLTVSSCAALSQLRGPDWTEQAAPVLVAPSTEKAAEVEVAAGEVWKTVLREAAAAGVGKGVVSGMVGGMVGAGSGAGGGGGPGSAAALSSKASVTVVLKGGGCIRIIPGEEFQYWRWASALSLAVSGSSRESAEDDVGSSSTSIRTVMKEVRTYLGGSDGSSSSSSGPNQEKNPDAVCCLRPAEGSMSWAKTLAGPQYEIPLSSVKGLVLSQSHGESCKFLFTVTVVSGCLTGIADSTSSWAGGKLQSYCRVEAGGEKSRTKVATGGTPFWNHRCTFAVSEAEAMSPGGGARICCLSHRVAQQDTQIGESFIPFSALTSGKDYTETLDISGNLRRLRLVLHSARGLVSSDVTGVSDPYCVVVPIRHDGSEVTSEKGETSWRRGGTRQRPEEWQESFELCRWCTPEEVKGVKVSLLDRDMGGRKDEALGEVFIPIASFKEPKARRTKVEMKVGPPPVDSSRFSKTLGKYNINIKTPNINIKTPNINLLGGVGGRSPSASPTRGRSPSASPTREPPDLGMLCVSMSVIETELPDTSSYKGRGVPPGGVKIRCSLDLADEFTCAWPALLLRHESPMASSGGVGGDEDHDDENEGGGEGERGAVEKWRVSAGFGGLVLSKVASGEGAAADSSPFLRMDPSGPADGYVMEVYENQRKKQPWGWGSGRKRHLRTSDPGRFSDAKGENRLHVKLLDQAEVPAGWAWSAPAWTVVGGDCPRDKDGWTYGTDSSFSALLADRSSGFGKEQKGAAVRCRRWVRPLQRTGMVSSTSTFSPRAGSDQQAGAGADIIPEGLRPFCRPDVDGRVMALVHENQRYQPGAGWGSSDEDHLLPEDRAPLTGASGVHAIDDLDDIDPSSLGPPGYRWEDEDPNHDDAFADGWNAGPWTYAESFETLPSELKQSAGPPMPLAGGGGGGSRLLPKSPPPPPPDRPAGVRSRVWWRSMVAADSGGAVGSVGSRVVSMGRKRDSVAVGRRKVPHATTLAGAGNGNGNGNGNGGGGHGAGDRIRVPLDRLKRAAVIGPNTLIVELEVEGRGGEWRPATLVVGPCDAPRLGSLLVERAATALPRQSLGQVVRRARKLLSKPPPLPPRPSGKGLGSSNGGGGAGETTAPAPAAPKLRSNPKKKDSNTSTSTSDNPFGSGASASSSKNPFASGDAVGRRDGGTGSTSASAPSPSSASLSPPPLPRRSGSPFQSAESQHPNQQAALIASPRGRPEFSSTSSTGGSGGAAAAALEAVLTEAVGLLQQAGRAVAALDDAYNAAYNASAAADGWGGQGHDVAELGEAVLWTLWSRLVRLLSYLRQLLAETPAQKLHVCSAVKREDWSVVVACMDTEAARQRSIIEAELEAESAGADSEEVSRRAAGRQLEGSMKAVKGLCSALDRRVTEMLLCADTVPESVLRRAVEVVASQCYTKVVDEVGRHITFRYEGVLPLADQELLSLLDILVNKADLIERTLQPRLDLVGWRSSPPPLLTKAVSVPWLLRAYATSIERKLSGLFRNILDTNKETLHFPPEPSTTDQDGEAPPKSPTTLMRMKLGVRGGGGLATGGKPKQQKKQGFSMWTLHESTAKPLSVVPTTAIALLDTYVVTVAKRFPDDAAVQAVILRAGAAALGSLRNVISAHAEAAVSTCPERGWDKLLRFLCATANDCWQLVSDALPAVEERHPQAMSEGAEDSYETLKELWVLLGVSCCRKAARLVLGFMEADGLFALEGIHVAGAEQSMVEIREALEYYCINFLRPWLEEYFYQKVLVRLCDHIVVWAAQGLVRAAAAGHPPLDPGQHLRLAACRETLTEALRTCSVQKEGGAGGYDGAPGGGEGGAGGGMYERRLAFLDDLLELLRVPSGEMEGVFTRMLGQHIHCQRSVQHALQVVLFLREDGNTVPEGVSKWADESNWMGGDAVVLTADTAEIEPFHRVFRRPLSLLRTDPTPLVAPTVLNRASDGTRRRQSTASLTAGKTSKNENANDKSGNPYTGGDAGAGGGGGAAGWAKRGLAFAGSGGLGIALGGDGAGSAGSGMGVKKGMAKFKKGLRKASERAAGGARSGRGGSRGEGAGVAVAMSGVGVSGTEPQTVLRVTILEAEGIRNVAVLKKTDSYVAAELVTTAGKRESRTSVKKNTCDPKWNEPLSFVIPSGSLVDAQLSLRVIGKQKVRDDLSLGRVELPLAGISTAAATGRGEVGGWFELMDGQGRLKIDADLVTRRPSLIV